MKHVIWIYHNGGYWQVKDIVFPGAVTSLLKRVEKVISKKPL